MIDNKVYQYIADEIFEFVPDKWDKVVIHLEYGADMYSFAFYVKKNGIYMKCFDIPEIDEKELLHTFRRIDDVLSEKRDESVEKWTSLTMVVTSDWKMNADFLYEDITEDLFAYEADWKKKYLT